MTNQNLTQRTTEDAVKTPSKKSGCLRKLGYTAAALTAFVAGCPFVAKPILNSLDYCSYEHAVARISGANDHKFIKVETLRNDKDIKAGFYIRFEDEDKEIKPVYTLGGLREPVLAFHVRDESEIAPYVKSHEKEMIKLFKDRGYCVIGEYFPY